MKKQNFIYVIIIMVVILGGLALFLNKNASSPIDNQTNNSDSTLTYTNSDLGFSFEYPGTYVVEERDLDTANRYHKSLVLMPVGYVAPVGGEGPTTINVDVYQNNLDKQSVELWVKGSAQSNYKLGDGVITPTAVSGVSALSYNWDGLYSGHTVVFAHAENIITVSETFLSPTDKIRSDFQLVINSFKLLPITPVASNKLPQTIVENYLKENISRISPEKEVLGGKFYITEVKLKDGRSGEVSYEDGHVAFTADFNYEVSASGIVTVNSFVIRK